MKRKREVDLTKATKSEMASRSERMTGSRRSLFPTAYTKKTKKELNVSFSPYARCLKLEPQKLTEAEMQTLWWQKTDYDDFARVGRIISKAMLEGGSEVWLESDSFSSRNCEHGSPTRSKDDTVVDTPTSTSPAVSPLHMRDSISESDSQDCSEMEDKWWHKFGHSRRGLEHLTCFSEGRDRQASARESIRLVLDEQKRQQMFLPKGYFDVDKFRSVYHKATYWARTLAQAAGASDEDAIKSKFNEKRRKSREYYLKQHFDTQSECPVDDADLPPFMTSSSPKRPTKRINLDANTISQLCFRRSQAVFPDKTKLVQMQSEKHKPKCGENKDVTCQKHSSSNIVEEKKSEDIDNDGDDDNQTAASTCTDDSSTSLSKITSGWEKNQSSTKDIRIGMSISPKPNMTIG